ncbi:16S rRNA (guanine(527)-N(7))-methyltransferase RsmG [Mycoplasma marinum]|uniref:Ribosomal RNA small subunit methyltransferase G n=1 Tax=Mycoplasma marinum TaxID=1937190 RepID=A0A4R0XR63_9MOLU|nr:16S rRNA (guanine(527)-N(7))-methyltransferase RsmG [Mycoplasma marinum]TCG10880.1 16S rRNA (guanine(527)-N(7))-methyltransferase RsmG [Mycoplasma marinum]
MTFKEKTKKHINNEELFTKLCKYVDMIEETNKYMNLTGFTGDKLWEEGIYESITALETGINNPNGKLMLDIGAGAGFPSIPYLIVHPELNVVIYEPSKKRTDFLAEVSKILGLNVEIQRIRVEDSKERERFDIVTARAVVKFKHLLEASHHVAKMNGEFVFVKGPKAHIEIEEAIQTSKKFGVWAKRIDISTEEKSNNLIYYRKEKETPAKYPRAWSVITKKR